MKPSSSLSSSYSEESKNTSSSNVESNSVESSQLKSDIKERESTIEDNKESNPMTLSGSNIKSQHNLLDDNRSESDFVMPHSLLNYYSNNFMVEFDENK
jgi:hypothetical protein